MPLWTNAGINLVASAVQSPGVNAAISYVALGTGCGTLASALSSGTAYTALPLNAGIPVAVSSGQSLTITDGTNTQTVTVASGGASIGATSIPVTSFNASANFAANLAGVCPTPLATDLALYNETQRVAANAGVSGANPGESLNAGYCDGTQATAFYMQVGFFGGSTATNTLGTGTLMIEDIQVWNHTVNTDSNMFQADSTV